MHFSAPLVTLATAQIAFAASIPRTQTTIVQPVSTAQALAFKVPRVPVGPARSRNAVRDLKHMMSKHGMVIPDGLANANESAWEAPPHAVRGVFPRASNGSGTGQVSNNPFNNDYAYTSPVTIGGQQLNLVFDTGSADLWVYNTATGAQYQHGQHLFDPSKSSTWKVMQGSTFRLSYGLSGNDGQTSGDTVGTDTVEIGGLSVQGQAVELPTQVSNQFQQNTPEDGLVGFAHSAANDVSPQKVPTFFENLAPLLTQPVMGANFKPGSAGSFDFGQLDSSAFTGQIQWVDSDALQGQWTFPSSSYAIGNGQPKQTTQQRPAIPDTGSSALNVDKGVAQDYWSQVQGAALNQQSGLYFFPCNTQLPDFHVQLAGNSLSTIPGQLINRGPTSDPSTCAGGIVPIDDSAQIQVYGDILFKAQYVAFNVQNNQVGFAPHA